MKSKQHLSSHGSNARSVSEFPFTISRVAVAQICQSAGFKAAQKSALEILTDVATRYLRAMAAAAVASATSQGRTESNLLDIVAALEDLGTGRGFEGASEVGNFTLFSSGVLKELMKFVAYSDEIPFAQPLPRQMFSQGRNRKYLRYRVNSNNYNSNNYCDAENMRHVPRWLPLQPVISEEENEKFKVRRREAQWGCLETVVRGSGESERECMDKGENGVEMEGEVGGMGCLDVGNRGVERGGNREIERLEKRGKVRFKIQSGENGVVGKRVGELEGGVGMYRGGGIGKRVLCHSWSGDGGQEDDAKKRVAMKKKKLI